MQHMSTSDLAIYLDELDDDPIKACDTAKSIGITNICLRRVWATNIGKATDNACMQLLSAIRKNNLSVLSVCVEDGRAPIDQLQYNEAVKRSITIAAYFKAKYFRPFIGLKSPISKRTGTLDTWLVTIGNECTKSSIIPIFEIDPNADVFEPSDVAIVLEKHSSWRLLYDPALLVINRNQNPLVRYWYLLRNKSAIIDLHDFKDGGFVPAGTGACKLSDTIRDCITNSYRGWFVIEPGTSRRANAASNRIDIVRSIISNYTQMVVNGRKKIASWSGADNQGDNHG